MRAVVMTTPPRGPRGLRIMWGSPEGAIPARSGYPAPAATPSPASAWALADNSGKRQSVLRRRPGLKETLKGCWGQSCGVAIADSYQQAAGPGRRDWRVSWEPQLQPEL